MNEMDSTNFLLCIAKSLLCSYANNLQQHIYFKIIFKIGCREILTLKRRCKLLYAYFSLG